ncbi:hypothetical protein [Adhaeribacter terreus]|uniref:Uncharacterized protein n=1 Tax=Adhaeribacter terreus TaxID=529703 RepID=A0ABW0ECQ2_9BACT
MKINNNISSQLSRIRKKAKRIFKISYEDLSAQIFYDQRNTFQLQLCRDVQCREEVLLTREISRAQAFHIMNTRN